MYKLVIFDLDGTLLDTLEDLAAATNATLCKYGYPRRSVEEVRSFVGNGVLKLIERASGETGEKAKEMLPFFQTYYKAHCKDKTKPYDGILSLLETLRKKGCILAMVSNKPDYAVKVLAEEYFPNTMYAAIGEKEPIVRKKPAPDSVLKVMESSKISARETLFVGDSEVDIETAKNAGVACVSVCWGFKDEAFLKEHGAERLIYEPRQLSDFIEEV